MDAPRSLALTGQAVLEKNMFEYNNDIFSPGTVANNSLGPNVFHKD